MEDLNNNSSSDSDPSSVILYPDPKKCLGRVPSLSKVDGLESSEIELLNNWFLNQWKIVYSSGFVMNESVTRGFTEYLQTNSFIAVDLDKVDSYLSVQKLLYNGLRLELDDSSENVSQCKLFHRYYYSCRENPTSLNNPVVLSNVIWSLKKYKRDEFALTCLVDVLLQSYMVALDSFISLGGVTVIRETFEFLARNSRLKQSTKFLHKCMDLLDKLDINLEILQTSRIGVHVNSIALAKSNPKLKLDYECGDDKVKLKATNLIKKWKAIRDASMPNKTNTEDLRVKKQPVPSPEKRLERQHTFDSSPGHEPEGSFVLNIINTMAEQKEREKKRKMEIRNSQMGGKFKSKTSEEKVEGDDSSSHSVNGTTGASGITSSSTSTSTSDTKSTKSTTSSVVPVEEHTDRDPTISSRTTDTTNDRVKYQKTGHDYSVKDSARSLDRNKTSEKVDRSKLDQKQMESNVEKKSSDNQLASLMNFFKEYSSKTEEKKSSLQESPVQPPHQQVQPPVVPVAPVPFQQHPPTMVGKPKPPPGPPPLSSMVNAVPPNIPNLQMGGGMLPGQGPVPGPAPGPGGLGPIPNLMEPPINGRTFPPNDFRGNFQEVPQPMFNAFPLLGQALPPGFIPPPPPPPAPPAPPGHPPFQSVQMDPLGQHNPGVVPPVNYNFEFQNPGGQLYQENQYGFYPMASKKQHSDESEDNAPPPWK